MPRLLLPLWMVILNFSENQLAQIIEYLREENKILRGKLPKRITLTDREKARLVKYGKTLGSGIRSVVTIVSPRTFLRWVKGEKVAGKSKRKPGRPKTDIEVRDLILKIARETGWGFTRILGELKKLGVRVSRTTVLNILTEAGNRDPNNSPSRRRRIGSVQIWLGPRAAHGDRNDSQSCL